MEKGETSPSLLYVYYTYNYMCNKRLKASSEVLLSPKKKSNFFFHPNLTKLGYPLGIYLRANHAKKNLKSNKRFRRYGGSNVRNDSEPPFWVIYVIFDAKIRKFNCTIVNKHHNIGYCQIIYGRGATVLLQRAVLCTNEIPTIVLAWYVCMTIVCVVYTMYNVLPI